jgi:recombination protein RecA
MALPLPLLEQLPASFGRGELRHELPVLSLGIDALDAVLPEGGLPRGKVIELAVASGIALGTSVGLSACRSAQKETEAQGSDALSAARWCAFVDPSGTLHAPGVVGAGVRLDRLLVVRPSLEALERTAIRLVESQAFAVVVLDTVGVPGARPHVSLGTWPRVIRRLSLAMEGSGTTVLLITDSDAHRPLPLPVAMRLELIRTAVDHLSIEVAKDRRGRVSGPRTVAWARRGRAPSGEVTALSSVAPIAAPITLKRLA